MFFCTRPQQCRTQCDLLRSAAASGCLHASSPDDVAIDCSQVVRREPYLMSDVSSFVRRTIPALAAFHLVGACARRRRLHNSRMVSFPRHAERQGPVVVSPDAESEITDDEQLREEQEKQWSQNEDFAVPIRIGSLLAYLLPLTDALRFGVHLQEETLSLPKWEVATSLANTPLFGPEGYLIVLATMQLLAGIESLPVLLRYNLRQATFLVIFLGTLSLLGTVLDIGINDVLQIQIPVQLSILVSASLYFAVAGCSVYSMAVCLQGKPPAGIGIISKLVGNESDDNFK